MKSLLLILLFCCFTLEHLAVNSDTTIYRYVRGNFHGGIGTSVYRYKYFIHDDVDFNLLHKKVYYRTNAWITLGTSFSVDNVRLRAEIESDIKTINIVKFSAGYNFLNIIKKNNEHKLYVYANYGVTCHFSIRNRYPTFSLFGFTAAYQYKRFEVYYNLLKYNRVIFPEFK